MVVNSTANQDKPKKRGISSALQKKEKDERQQKQAQRNSRKENLIQNDKGSGAFMNHIIIRKILTGTLAIFSAMSVQAAVVQNKDPEIIQALMTANKGEVEVANLAMTKSQNSEVKQFAIMMAKKHGESDQELRTLAATLQMAPESSLKSTKMGAINDFKMQKLESTKIEEFDKKYIDYQVNAHRKLLEQIDQKFLPQVQSPELKELLGKTRADVQGHLTSIEQIQTHLSR